MTGDLTPPTIGPAAADAPPPDESLLIQEDAALADAMATLEDARPYFTVFVLNADKQVVGVLSRGDVIRCLVASGLQSLPILQVRNAMTARVSSDSVASMLFIQADHSKTWYQQLTEHRDSNVTRWGRIKLVPVLDTDFRLVNVLDLASPRTRSRLETIVMAAAFASETGYTSAASLARRSKEFDSIHYGTHRKKVAGLCDVLLQKPAGHFAMLDDVFNNARADEIVLGLFRAEEWLKGHVSNHDMDASAQKALLGKVAAARDELVTRYSNAVNSTYFPTSVPRDVIKTPEVIVVLGCRDQDALRERVQAAWRVVQDTEGEGARPILVLSGGGDGHEESEARRMLGLLEVECAKHSNSSWSAASAELVVVGKRVDVLLEEDSLDTLGNAVFTWFTLKLKQSRFGLRAKDSPRLDKLVLVTDGIHAPRSYDVFRRVFAYRASPGVPSSPRLAVRTVERRDATADQKTKALDHLRSEARVNAETFRLVNPLTNGFDIIEDGHVRSILGQMLRLHQLYRGRWDLVRKFQSCWHDDPSTA